MSGPRSFEGEVLSTLNRDGSRRWIRPQLSRGRFYRWRLAVGWALIAVFGLLPHLRVGGKPALLLDVAHRKFTLLGTTFLPTDTGLLLILLLVVCVAIFLLTALFGRVWCGWGCPQTVYMELLFRPLERLTEGGRTRQMELDRKGPNGRRVLKYAVFLVLSVLLGNTFLAYFVGTGALFHWMSGSPAEHPAAFAVMATTAVLVFGDFAFFREQMCTVACPYARLQSVLQDRHSLLVGYDARRGEPRGKLGKGAGDTPRGDCIDCRACATTCPMGIDVRQGSQLECIGCTQCIDACDAIMDRVGRPRGLIRYTSEAELEEGPQASARLLRPRVVAYSVLLLGLVVALVVALASRAEAEVTVLRGLGAPFIEQPDGRIANALRIRIANRTDEPRSYTIALAVPGGVELIAPVNPVSVEPGATATANAFAVVPRSAFAAGRRDVEVLVSDMTGFSEQVPYRLLGPTGAGGEGAR